MKNNFLILISLIPFLLSSQNDKESIFVSTNIIEIYANNESNFSNQPIVHKTGFGVEINSFNGILIFKRIVISIGTGISFNVNEDFKSIPIVADIKWYLNPYGINSPYVNLNTGRNLKVGSFYGGQSSKLGIGLTFESDYDFQYVIEAFIKSKEFTINKESNFNYLVNSFGISIGVKL